MQTNLSKFRLAFHSDLTVSRWSPISLTGEALAVGIDLTVAVARRSGHDGDLAVGGDLLDAVDLPLVRLGDIQQTPVRHGDGLGGLQGGMYGRLAQQEVIQTRDLAVDRTTGHDSNLQGLGDLQDDVVVQDVEGVVHGVDGQIRRPLQTDLRGQNESIRSSRKETLPKHPACIHTLYLS